TGIKSAARPVEKPDDSLYFHDENTEPTDRRNFADRLLACQQSYYTDFVVALPPDKRKTDKALGELMSDSEDVTKLMRGLEANYNNFAPKYQNIAKEINNNIERLSHTTSLES